LSIIVVGSIALDDVETPSGKRTRALGGACTYFSAAASLYTRVAIVGVVGNDFPTEHVEFFHSRNIDTRGLQVADGKTFFWSGRYGANLDDCQTLDTQLNVFGDFHPVIPEDLRDTPYVFLANIDPELQIEVLSQMRSPRVTVLDSMNFWIESKREALTEAIKQVDILLLNESEVRLYTEDDNLLRATQAVLELGPKVLIVKRGEHGAALVTRRASLGERYFLMPAYPLEHVVDPTGAGDTFAAGFVGYLAMTNGLSLQALRRAAVHGTVTASYACEDFSIDRMRNLTMDDVQERYHEFRCLTYFEPLRTDECGVFQRNVIG